MQDDGTATVLAFGVHRFFFPPRLCRQPERSGDLVSSRRAGSRQQPGGLARAPRMLFRHQPMHDCVERHHRPAPERGVGFEISGAANTPSRGALALAGLSAFQRSASEGLPGWLGGAVACGNSPAAIDRFFQDVGGALLLAWRAETGCLRSARERLHRAASCAGTVARMAGVGATTCSLLHCAGAGVFR